MKRILIVVREVIACCLLSYMVLSLSSCSYYKDFAHKEQEKTACHHVCQDKLRHCLAICHNSRHDCSVSAHMHASRQHQKYQREQMIQGQDEVLELNSFRDPLQCQKTTCECREDVRVCRQFCDGRIRKRLQVVPKPC